MCDSRTGGNGNAGTRRSDPGIVGTTGGKGEWTDAANDPLLLVQAIGTAAARCRYDAHEPDVLYAISIHRSERTYAAQLWNAISTIPCGVRMRLVPDGRTAERAVLMFLREATKGQAKDEG